MNSAKLNCLVTAAASARLRIKRLASRNEELFRKDLLL
jgi:hypothetical protein